MYVLMSVCVWFQFILEPLPAANPLDPIVALDPLVKALKDSRQELIRIYFQTVQVRLC